MKHYVAGLAGCALALVAMSAWAEGQVNIICSVQMSWCQAVGAAFTKETGINVGIVQKSSGEAMAQIAAERANPKLDVYYTGTGDPHLQAAEMGLNEESTGAQEQIGMLVRLALGSVLASPTDGTSGSCGWRAFAVTASAFMRLPLM